MQQCGDLRVLVACFSSDNPVLMQASVELQNCCTSTAISLMPWHQTKHSASLLDRVQQLWRQSDLPDARQSLDGLVNNSSLPLSANDLPPHTFKSLINPNEIQICHRSDGQAWVLGAGTYGMVSHKVPYM